MARGMTSADLARAADIKPPTMSKIDLGQRGVTKNTADGLATGLGVTVPDLYAAIGSPIPPPDPALSTAAFRLAGASFAVNAPPAFPAVPLPRDLPVYGSAEGGPAGSFAPPNSALMVDWVVRPPGLFGLRDAFALICEGHSMEPRFFPGELLYIHPARPPKPGDYVVAVLTDPSWGEDRGYVKRLLRRSAEAVTLFQHNPEREIVLLPSQVRRLFRVLLPSDLYGS